MSYQVDSYGNAYFPAGVSVASIPATTGTQAKVLVPGANGRISSATIAQLVTQSGGNIVSSIFGRTGVVVAKEGDYTTDQITEGQAQYFSNSKARKSIFLTTFNTSGPATYDTNTGILNIPQYGSGAASPTNFVPLTRTITINGQIADLSVDRIFSVASMVYPSAGIALSNGVSWEPSITNNSANWNTAYTDRMKWDGGATGLVAATGRTSLGLVIGTDVLAYRTFGTAANSAATDFALAVHTHTIANVTGLQTALDGKEPSIAAGTTLQYWRGDKSFQTLPIYSLPIASTTILGGVKVDGVTITIDANGVISGANTYVLPTATSTILGGVKIGAGVTITSGVISVSTNYEAPITAGTTLQYFRGDKTFQTLPIYTLAGLGGQPLDADLTAIAALAGTSGFLKKTAADTWALDNSTYLTSYTETDPIWTAEKTSYYTKTAADARYLQSYTETDPIWISEKANYALKTYVDTSISNLVASAPAALNTLNELALALGSDANFSTTVTTLIGTKEPSITAGTTLQYWRGDKSWQTLPIYTLSGLGGEPTITAGTTSEYWRGDKSWQTLPVYTLAGLGGQAQLNGTGFVKASGTTITYDNSTYYLASNPSGYISSYTETDTLSSVTARGASTTSNIVVGNISFQGVGGNSGQSAPGSDYRIYQAPGAWSAPYPDLNIAWHTGISIGAYFSYGGTRFYNNSDMVTETFSVNNGDNHVRVAYNLYVTGTVTGSNLSGTNTGDQTLPTLSSLNGQPQLNGTGFVKAVGTTITYDNSTYYLASNPSGYITSYTETDTLGSVTARGATTSTALTLSSQANNFGGHHYFISYDAAGNHYPHYQNGSSNVGAIVNTRVYTGSGASWRLFVLNGQTAGISWDGNVIYHAGNIPTWNQNTTGTAANITATTNSTLTTLSSLSLPYSQLSGTVPTWNQSTTGNAATVTNATFYRQFTVRDDRSDGSDYSLAARATGLYAINSTGTNGPGYGYLSLIHVSNGSDVAFQIAGGYNSDAMYFRGTYALQNGTGYSAWRTVIHSGNIASQTVTYATGETLATVTGRGATTSTAVIINNNLAVNTASPYATGTYSLDINGGLLVKNTGRASNITLINSDPAGGGNHAFVIHTVSGTLGSSLVDIQGYYGANVTGSTTIRLNPLGGNVTINGYTVYHSGNLPTIPTNTSFVPYTGATADVNLSTRALSAGNILGVTLSASQTSNTQSSLVVTNGGTFRIADFNNSGALVAYITNAGGIYGSSFIKSGGSSSQYLKADGSVDSNTYITSSGSISGTASNITAYTINQSVGTGNSPTFAGLTVSGPVYQGAANQGVISLLSDVVVGQTNNYFRLYLPQGYYDNRNGGTATIKIVWGMLHAGVTYSQEYKLTFGTNHGAGGNYLHSSQVTKTYSDQNPESYGGYLMDQTPAVDFYQDMSGGYINFNVKGYQGYNTHRVVAVDIVGGGVGTPTLTYYGASSPGGSALTVKDIPYATTAGSANSVAWTNVSSRPTALSSFTNDVALPLNGNWVGNTGMNDQKLYLRTNGDNNHYLWNAADDWEELIYYTGTGFRIKGSTGTVSALFTDGGLTVTGAISASGALTVGGISTLNGAVNINRHIDANTTWGSCTSIFVGWSSSKVILGNNANTGHDYALNLGCNSVVSTNAFYCHQDITAFSDARVKENVQIVDNALDKIQAIRGVTFTRNDTDDIDKRHVGVIAQEVLAVLPEAVSEDDRGYYSVAYGNMAALFIEAIKEQQAQIEEMKKEIKELKNK